MKGNQKKENGTGIAKLMEKAARKSALATTGNRCTFILHQPKMPPNLKDIKS